MEMRNVVGYEDYYAIADDGRVWSKRSKRFLSTGYAPNGYETLTLSVNGKGESKWVHRLVCEAFHGIPEGKNMVVDHINANKQDNRAVNLRWVEQKDNVGFAHALGLCDDRPIVLFNDSGDVLRYPSTRAARRDGFRPDSVLSGQCFLTRGYAVVYEEEWPLPVGVYFEQLEGRLARGRARKRDSSRHARPVRGISLEDGSVIEFPSMSAAMRSGYPGVERCINGRAKSSGGYRWEVA